MLQIRVGVFVAATWVPSAPRRLDKKQWKLGEDKGAQRDSK